MNTAPALVENTCTGRLGAAPKAATTIKNGAATLIALQLYRRRRRVVAHRERADLFTGERVPTPEAMTGRRLGQKRRASFPCLESAFRAIPFCDASHLSSDTHA
jgi:hypothetical protein